MIFREFCANDLPDVLSLFKELIAHLMEETGDPYMQIDPDAGLENGLESYLRETLEGRDKTTIIAEDDGKIAGFICGEIRDSFFPPSVVKKTGYIFGAYTLPEYRRQGVMAQLEKILTDFFRSRKINYIELSFLSGNSLARKSWEAMGYGVFREQMRKNI
ncbi:MAG: GNAT family N-acetyltransferase [Brevinematales bacterium]|nr:GNAT family N-acetyltransferase [Brevinematales bacterium]